MPLILVTDAFPRALFETGDSVLTHILEHAYARGDDLVDYDAVKTAFDAGMLVDPGRLPPFDSEQFTKTIDSIRELFKGA